ncbi:hypothetical protein LWF15_04070 [Kineosporia rhizophila]|nr:MULTISPECIES: hypothetical protein [Kineosporia]MCE0534676.1 hypothetical protein [Kineosporia rhizophila]GLY19400.1 hypothetical protein Kisp01_64140 [Kineosporia sp. NBRC 101677]
MLPLAIIGGHRGNLKMRPGLIADVVNGKLVAVPRGVMAAGAILQGGRGGVDLPEKDVDRVKSHLAKYYAKMDDTAPWDR